jgi:hypothetical protein
MYIMNNDLIQSKDPTYIGPYDMKETCLVGINI